MKVFVRARNVPFYDENGENTTEKNGVKHVAWKKWRKIGQKISIFFRGWREKKKKVEAVSKLPRTRMAYTLLGVTIYQFDSSEIFSNNFRYPLRKFFHPPRIRGC